MINALVSDCVECMNFNKLKEFDFKIEIPPITLPTFEFEFNIESPIPEVEIPKPQIPDPNEYLPSIDMPGFQGLLNGLLQMLMDKFQDIQQFIPPDPLELPDLNMFDLQGMVDDLLQKLKDQGALPPFDQPDLSDLGISIPQYGMPEAPGIPALPQFPNFDPSQLIKLLMGFQQSMLDMLKGILESVISLQPKIPTASEIQQMLYDAIKGLLPNLPEFPELEYPYLGLPELPMLETCGCMQNQIESLASSLLPI